MRRIIESFMVCLIAVSPAFACGGDDDDGDSQGSPDGGGVSGDPDGSVGDPDGSSNADPENPPITGREDIEAWLAAGYYNQWACEPDAHDPRSPSPHGPNRICSNARASAAGAGEYPVDSASVKELFDDAGENVVGYAVSRHVSAGTTGGTWYWYERVPLDSPVPHDANGVVVSGLGDSGVALDVCVGCHQLAGSDPEHSGHDFVYTQVQ